MRISRYFSLALAISFLVAGQVGARSIEVTLVYGGNLEGELEPCGCSAEGDLGGLRRQASLLEYWRGERPDLFLLSSGGALSSATPRDRLKSEYILKALAALRFDAVGLQWRDLAYGARFLSQSPLAWVASNAADPAGLPRERVIERAGVKLAFFAWVEPDRFALGGAMEAEHAGLTADSGPTAKALAQAKRRGALTVLSTTLPLEEARIRFPLHEVDILLIRAAFEVYGEPSLLGRTLVLQPGSRGTRLARLDLEFEAAGRISSWQHRVVALSPAIANAPSLQSWYDEYNAKAKQAYLASVEAKNAARSAYSPYAGAQACQGCHAQAFWVWSQSAHANAYARLQQVGKAFDADCIACHTVGFDTPGGFVDRVGTPELAGVQCESCHDAARSHAESNGARRVPTTGASRSQMCAQCHVRKHSPSFDLERYWQRVAH